MPSLGAVKTLSFKLNDFPKFRTSSSNLTTDASDFPENEIFWTAKQITLLVKGVSIWGARKLNLKNK